MWNSLEYFFDYGDKDFQSDAQDKCRTECVFVYEKAYIYAADGVLFNVANHGETDFPSCKNPRAKYIGIMLEPPINSYSNFSDEVRSLCDGRIYLGRFDYWMTYEKSSTVPLFYTSHQRAIGLDAGADYYWNSPLFKSFEEKVGLAASFVTRCTDAGAMRAALLAELTRLMPLDNYGPCNQNREEPQLVPEVNIWSRYENKIAILSNYKFGIAFENNNSTRDYVTEKVYQCLRAGAVPIYWGAPNVEDFVPAGSIIKASDFAGPAELAGAILEIAEDQERYEKYFQWRKNRTAAELWQRDIFSKSAYTYHAMCRLCDKLAAD
ncbi:unnamed protein product, partial [Phaeothamnion confervicola]